MLMRRLFTLLTAALLLSRAHAAAAQTADEVAEKLVAAMGGRPALSKIRSRTMTGTIALSTPGGDISGAIEVYNKAPNKSRSVIKLDLSQFGAGPVAIDQRFDGTTGYVVDPLQGNRELTGDQLENQKNGSFPTPMLDYKERGVTATLLPKEKVAGRDTFVLQLAAKKGTPIKYYIDAETYMLVRSAVTVNVPQLNADVESTVDFSDYRMIDGVKIPFVTKLSSSVQNYTITVSKVEHNTDIDDKSFVKPEK
jgi:zinc protease